MGHTTASSPLPPFSLSRLELEVNGKVEDFLLPKLFMGSTDTLTTLTFHHLTPTPSRAPTIASILDILSHTSFPNMRDLSISAGELGSILPLLPLLPFLLTLQTLTLTRTSFCDGGRPPFAPSGSWSPRRSWR